MHAEPRAAWLFLLASRSPRPGDRCRYPDYVGEMLTPHAVIWIQAIATGAFTPLFWEFGLSRRMGILRSAVTAPWLSIIILFTNCVSSAVLSAEGGPNLSRASRGVAGFIYVLPYLSLTMLAASFSAATASFILDICADESASAPRFQFTTRTVLILVFNLGIIFWELSTFIQHDTC